MRTEQHFILLVTVLALLGNAGCYRHQGSEPDKPVLKPSGRSADRAATQKLLAQAPVKQLVEQLAGTDWKSVFAAKEALESRGEEAIPLLLDLAASSQRAELKGPIMVGPEAQYGREPRLGYDLNLVGVRAGWALEDTTFHSFGFQHRLATASNNQSSMMDRVKKDAPPPTPPESPEARQQRLEQAIESARAWWKTAQRPFNRKASLLEALRSTDDHRQIRALSYLHYGETACDGLTMDAYTQEVGPEIKKLTRATSPNVKAESLALEAIKNPAPLLAAKQGGGRVVQGDIDSH